MKKLSASIENEQYKRIQQRVKDGRAQNPSEALRQELRGENVKTETQKKWDRAGNILAMIGLTMLGMTVFFPVEIRIITIIPLVGAIWCYSIGQLTGVSGVFTNE